MGVRGLGRRPQGQPVLDPVVVGHRAARLERSRVHAREDDLLRERDVGPGEDRLGGGGVAGLPLEAEVVGLAGDVVADQRRVGVERPPGVDDRRQRPRTRRRSARGRRARRSGPRRRRRRPPGPGSAPCRWPAPAGRSPGRVGIQASPRASSIAPVTTARTFGWASAAEGVDPDTIRACATGERRMARWSIPVSCRSSVNCPRRGPGAGPPCGASGRARRASDLGRLQVEPAHWRPPAVVGVLGRPPHRADDGGVAGAPADLARDGLADRLVARVGIAVEQRARGQQHPRRAEAALQPVALHEALLDRVEDTVHLEVLDGLRRRGRRPSAASTVHDFTGSPSYRTPTTSVSRWIWPRPGPSSPTSRSARS